jgi:hypothetical protein
VLRGANAVADVGPVDINGTGSEKYVTPLDLAQTAASLPGGTRADRAVLTSYVDRVTGYLTIEQVVVSSKGAAIGSFDVTFSKFGLTVKVTPPA